MAGLPPAASPRHCLTKPSSMHSLSAANHSSCSRSTGSCRVTREITTSHPKPAHVHPLSHSQALPQITPHMSHDPLPTTHASSEVQRRHFLPAARPRQATRARRARRHSARYSAQSQAIPRAGQPGHSSKGAARERAKRSLSRALVLEGLGATRLAKLLVGALPVLQQLLGVLNTTQNSTETKRNKM
jgi:hypothetical protein